MRVHVVLHYASLLLMIVGACMLLPLGFSLYYDESDTVPFAVSIGISAGLGLLLFVVTPGARRVSISRREAMALVSISWVLASLAGALPFFFADTFPSFGDCLFEAVSGFTTTGASVMTSIESQPHGILLWRDFTQWLGGMGIVVLFVSFFPLLGMGTAYLFEAEAPGPEVQRLRAHIRDTSRTIWVLYVCFTALEVILLLGIGNLSFFDSLSHAFGTMATGGFSPRDASVGAYNSIPVNVVVICFMFMAGINYALYYSLIWRRSLTTFIGNTEFRVYALLAVSAMVFMAADLMTHADYSAKKAFEEAAFHSVSIQTTTGFAISDFNEWPAYSRLVLLILMVIGASAGSTGGALKVIRMVVLTKYTYRQILLAFNPQAVMPIRLSGKVLSDRLVSRIVGFSVLYVAIMITASLIMTGLGLNLTTAVSSVVASIGNIGPGLGMVGPAANYASIPALGKAVLVVCMLVGRLELVTMLALFTPVFWRWR